MNEAILILNEEYFFSYLRLEQNRKKKKDVLSSWSLTLVFQRTTAFYKNYFLTQEIKKQNLCKKIRKNNGIL